MDTRGTVGRISKEEYYTLLHTKYKSSRPCGFREEVFFFFFFFFFKYLPVVMQWELISPGMGPFLTPRTRFEGFM